MVNLAVSCRTMVQGKYTKDNGYEETCEVIYGDTDSVMVDFKVTDTARAMELGRDAAEYVSKTFVKPIKLEFEKVLFHLVCHTLGLTCRFSNLAIRHFLGALNFFSNF